VRYGRSASSWHTHSADPAAREGERLPVKPLELSVSGDEFPGERV
jgi:hypothetical protein